RSNRESSGSPFFVHFSIRFKCFLFQIRKHHSFSLFFFGE
ncbi:unnamed protein product, partial [Musa acuminata subsp. malaccensis]